jgi:hypothetical protein
MAEGPLRKSKKAFVIEHTFHQNNLTPKEVIEIFNGVNGSSGMNRKHQPGFKHEETVVSLPSTGEKTFLGQH